MTDCAAYPAARPAQEAADDGEPWGAALVAEYQAALDEYGKQWGDSGGVKECLPPPGNTVE